MVSGGDLQSPKSLQAWWGVSRKYHYNIELVRTLLQHSSVNVTQRYIGSKELEDAIQKNVCLG